MSYRNLEIWKLARDLVIDIHKMTLSLPKFEMFEEGQQIRKSIKSVKSTMVEGYGRRRYKAEYVKFLTYSHASNDETVDHLETLYDTESLTTEEVYRRLKEKLDMLGRKLNKFIQAIENGHNSDR